MHQVLINVSVGEYQKKAIDLIARNNFEKRRGVSVKRKEKFSRLENKVVRLLWARPSIVRSILTDFCPAVVKISRTLSASSTLSE